MTHTNSTTSSTRLLALGTELLKCMVERLSTMLRARRHNTTIKKLSKEQAEDCGIVQYSKNIPTIDVPRGLMDKLMSMR